MEIILALILGLVILPASNANAGIVAASDGLTTINVTLGQITGTASVDGLTDTSSTTIYGSLNVNGTGGVTAVGPLTVASSVTVTGNAFSVGGSTLAVSYGKVGIGTTAPGSTLEVAGDLRVTNQPNISLYRATAQTISNGSGIEPIYWSNVVSSANVTFDAVSSSNTVTILKAGNYLITCQAQWTTAATGRRQVAIQTNVGTEAVTQHPATNIGLDTTHASKSVYLAVSDWVKCLTYQDSGSSLDIYGGRAATFMTIDRLW